MKFGLSLMMFLLAAGARAEMPPQAYAEMQEKAPEFLKIEVLSSTKESGAAENTINLEDLKKGVKSFHIHLTAKVLEVERSASGVKTGDVIKIDYTRTERPKGTGWVGPSEIPVLKKGDVTEAYLDENKKLNSFSPAARGRSFHTMEE